MPVNEHSVEALLDYLYIDHQRLRSYIEQIGNPRKLEKLNAWDVSISLAGPSVKGQQTISPRSPTDHEMLLMLREYLDKTGQLCFSRPVNHGDRGSSAGRFVLEDMLARRAIFPFQEAKEVIPGLKGLSVWVSDPDSLFLNNRGYSEGTFVYLVEAAWETSEDYSRLVSGFSALALVARDLGRGGLLREDVCDLLPLDIDSNAPLWQSQRRHKFDGYYGEIHPIEVLRTLGALIQPPRRIRSLYRKRYVSDEQLFRDSTGRHRSNDLLAYPIFIATLE